MRSIITAAAFATLAFCASATTSAAGTGHWYCTSDGIKSWTTSAATDAHGWKYDGDRTAYHEVVPSNELALALWLESDRMGYFWPGMTAERLAVQQSVVRAERRQRYENVPYGEERFAIAAADCSLSACILHPKPRPLAACR